MTTSGGRLILDANVMLGAILGRSFGFIVSLFERDVQLFTTVQQLAETRHQLTKRPNLPEEWIDAQMKRMLAVVTPIHPALLAPHEAPARARLGSRGAPDWPMVAATFALDAAAWSYDRDLFGSGVPVWSTRVLRQVWRHASEGADA